MGANELAECVNLTEIMDLKQEIRNYANLLLSIYLYILTSEEDFRWCSDLLKKSGDKI